MSVEVGQIWREVDPRFTRLVRVVEVSGERVQIETGSFRGVLWEGIRRTWASLRRFNGKRGGYEIYQLVRK